ncbi:MAG: Maf family nucleotide pyrophosphatase [Bacteroidia bacterium]
MLQLPYQIVLASGSPRRQELLKQLDLNFSIRLKEVEESYPNHLDVADIAEYLARKKAHAHQLESEDELLITADTLVVLKNEVLGKPADAAEAFELLRRQSGRPQWVYTGICLRSSESEKAFTVGTEVHFNHLTDEEIKYYIEHYKPYDKAGGYGIQEWLGSIAIARINGSYTNVMGLPTEALYNALKSYEL